MNDCCPWLGKTIFENPGVPPSASRCTIEVGDGTNSFGQFSGPDAIRQALEFAKTQPGEVKAVHILVLDGEYDVTGASDNLDFSGLAVVWIQVCHKFVPRITNRSSSVATIDSSTPVLVFLEGVRFATDGVAGVIKILGGLRMKECSVSTHRLALTPERFNALQPALLVEDCFFQGFNDGGLDSGPLIDIILNSQSDVVTGFFIDRCFLQSSDENPVFVIRADPALTQTVEVREIVFRDCTIRLGALKAGTVELTNAVNPGAFKIDIEGSDPTKFFLRDVTWQDCDVFANRAGEQTSSILLYIKGFNGNSPGTSVGFPIGLIKIQGGRWAAQENTKTDFSPFIIAGGPVLTENLFSFFPLLAEVVLDGVQLGFDRLSGLSPTASPKTHGRAPLEVSTFPAAAWAAFVVHALRIVVHDVRFSAMAAKSDSGDLRLFGAESIDVNGLTSLFYATGAGTGWPRGRIVISAITVGRAIVKNVRLAGPIGTQMVSSGGAGMIIGGEPAQTSVELEDCQVLNLFAAGVFQHGISVGFPVAATADTFSPPGGISLWKCSVSGCTGNGFDFTQIADVMPAYIHVDSGIFAFNLGHGIALFSTGALAFDQVMVHGNRCSFNVGFGILVAPGAWNVPPSGGSTNRIVVPIITDNICENNDAADIDKPVQIKIGRAGALGDNVAVICRNNQCLRVGDPPFSPTTAFAGAIGVVMPTSVLLTAPRLLNEFPQGLHTSVIVVADSGSSSGFALRKVHEFSSPAPEKLMIENAALFIQLPS